MPEENLSFEIIDIRDDETVRQRKKRRNKLLLTAALFLSAILCYGAYLSYLNTPIKRCEAFVTAFNSAFSGGSVNAVDVLLLDNTIIGYQGRKDEYIALRRHVRAYFASGGYFMGSAGIKGDVVVNGEKLFFSLEASGAYAGERRGVAGFRADIVMNADGLVSIYSDDELFGHIFFGIPE